MSHGRVDAATAKALAYIQSNQRSDGSFVTYVSKTEHPFRASRQFTANFTPAVILSSLSQIADAKPICDKLAAWLLLQKSSNWSFNYWAQSAPERKIRPYPDDLDDTFCALYALWQHDPSIIDGAGLANAVRLLIATEQEVGGPYRTWLAPKTATDWQDVDLVVNCNVATFLQAVAEPLPKLTAMMDRAIRTKDYSSSYYPSQYAVWFFLARACRGSLRGDLVKLIITKRRNGHWGTPGRTALALLALYYLGHSDVQQDGAAKYLLAAQQTDGSWPAEAFWLDEARGRAKWFAGSPVLTTAFVVEALAIAKKDKPKTQAIVHRIPQEYTKVMERVVVQTENLKSPLRAHMQTMVRHMQAGDTNHEIALLPHFFARSMANLKIEKNILVSLGAANFFGWLAYTIYDDFLDDEGKIQQLSIANVALRRSLECFRRALPHNAEYLQLVDEIFDRIDTANAWELQHCRFRVDGQNIWLGTLPHHGSVIRLSERSCGHLLTPIGVLASTGVAPGDPKTMILRKGMTHYLVARQLNDDLHDWKDDVQKGRISYVVASILEDLKVSAGKQSFAELLPKMEYEFWHHGLKKLCRTVLQQIAQARKAYEQTGLVAKDSKLFALLDGLEASMARTIQEQHRAEQFVTAYKETEVTTTSADD